MIYTREVIDIECDHCKTVTPYSDSDWRSWMVFAIPQQLTDNNIGDLMDNTIVVDLDYYRVLCHPCAQSFLAWWLPAAEVGVVAQPEQLQQQPRREP